MTHVEKNKMPLPVLREIGDHVTQVVLLLIYPSEA